jgi:hypothetical protein
VSQTRRTLPPEAMTPRLIRLAGILGLDIDTGTKPHYVVLCDCTMLRSPVPVDADPNGDTCDRCNVPLRFITVHDTILTHAGRTRVLMSHVSIGHPPDPNTDAQEGSNT